MHSYSRILRRLGACSAPLLSTLMIATPASAQGTSLAFGFSSTTPNTPTGMHLGIVYARADGSAGQPPIVKSLAINAPDGTQFHLASVPPCKATKFMLMVLGPSACPSASKIGGGTLTVTTAFRPLDPFVTTVELFANGTGWLETAQLPHTPLTLGLDQLKINGTALTGNPPRVPGFGPGFLSAPTTIDFNVTASSGFVTTPATCPATHEWVTTAAFTFRNAPPQTAQSSTPCE
jgi:hypothetical protein